MSAASADSVLPYPKPSELDLPRGDLWIFGYGSLMWDPGFPHVDWAPALIYGYHRELCIYSSRWRGTPERPGLVLGLDRGGACRGIAFRVAARDVATSLDALWVRDESELTAELVSSCCGGRGSNIDYLSLTIKHLEELGVKDHHLLRVMEAVRALRQK